MAKISGVASKPRVGKRNGKLYWKVYWTPCKGAKKIYDRVEAGTKRDAYYKLEKLKAQRQGGEYNAELSDFGIMLQELERSLVADGRPIKTRQQYAKVFNRVFGDFKKIYEARHKVSITGLHQIDYTYFIEYKDYFKVDLSRERGWHNELIRIKSLLNHLRRKKFCGRPLVYDVREELPTPPSNTVPYKNIADTDLEKLFAYIKKDRYDYYKPLRYIYLTGRRPGETTRYLKEDVVGGAAEPRELHIRAEITKTKRAGVLYIKNDLLPLIRDALRGNNTIWLFPNRHNRRCAVDKLYQYLKKTSKEVMGAEITPKYFRKRYHTKYMPKDMKNAMAVSGLKDVKVAMTHYNYSSAEGQANVLEKSKKGV